MDTKTHLSSERISTLQILTIRDKTGWELKIQDYAVSLTGIATMRR